MSNKNEDIYAQALEEFEGDNRNQGLYAKCFAEADGDENKAKARYIKSRADELSQKDISSASSKANDKKTRTDEITKSIVLKKTQEQSVGSREDKPEWLSHRLIPQICIGFMLGYLLISQINSCIVPKSDPEPTANTFYVGDSPDWLYGRWEEKPISGINLTRYMEFSKDGTVEIGQLEKTTINIQSYEVEGDLVIVDNSISDGFGFKLYYKKMKDGVLARATSSGAVESSDRYYKK